MKSDHQQAIEQCLTHASNVADFNISSVQSHEMNQSKAGKQYRATWWVSGGFRRLGRPAAGKSGKGGTLAGGAAGWLNAGPRPREGFTQGRVHLLGRTTSPAASLNTIQSLAGQHGVAG